VKEKKLKFVRILITEIEDLTEDLGEVLAMYGQKRDKGEMTEYVFLENSALLNSEISCLKGFESFVLGLKLDDFQSLEDLGDYVRDEFRMQRRGCGYAPAIEAVFERKLQKVLTYVKS
jgi:hypothetical protein